MLYCCTYLCCTVVIYIGQIADCIIYYEYKLITGIYIGQIADCIIYSEDKLITGIYIGQTADCIICYEYKMMRPTIIKYMLDNGKYLSGDNKIALSTAVNTYNNQINCTLQLSDIYILKYQHAITCKKSHYPPNSH